MALSDKFISVSEPTAASSIYQAPACPKCTSADTSSAAKRPTANSYWRCMNCGEVWNPAQRIGSAGRRMAP